MSTKTKTIAAAAIAALALPTAALAHDGDKDRGHCKDRGAERSEQRSVRGDDHRGKHHGWKHRRKAFVLAGVDATGLSVADGKLAGQLTVDPIHANKGARRLLDLGKDEIRGEDTVSFGTAGDEVRVKYRGLPEGEAPQPTDVVMVFGKIDRSSGELDIKKIWVKRRDAEAQAEGRDDDSDDDRKAGSSRRSHKR
jgi:hypothetical protein